MCRSAYFTDLLRWEKLHACVYYFKWSQYCILQELWVREETDVSTVLTALDTRGMLSDLN